MHPNQQTLEAFYSAFARLDADTMGNSYALEAVFEDEVFSLHGKREIAGMWRGTSAMGRIKGFAQCRAEVASRALPVGHFIAEEQHQKTARSLRSFFA